MEMLSSNLESSKIFLYGICLIIQKEELLLLVCLLLTL